MNLTIRLGIWVTAAAAFAVGCASDKGDGQSGGGDYVSSNPGGPSSRSGGLNAGEDAASGSGGTSS